jgi:hypothetical protein
MESKERDLLNKLSWIFLGCAPVIFNLLGLKYPTVTSLIILLYWAILLQVHVGLSSQLQKISDGEEVVERLKQGLQERKENPSVHSYTFTEEFRDYDAKGKLVKKQVFKDEKDAAETTIFKYDARGRCIQEIEEELDDDYDSGVLRTQLISEFDDKNNLIKQVQYFDGELNETEIITYDDDNRPIEYFFPNAEEGVSKMLSQYDANGRLTKVTRLRKNGDERDHEEYKYSPEGHLIEENSSLGNKVVYVRDAAGREIERSHYSNYEDNGIAPSEKVISKYDQAGNLLEESILKSDGQLGERTLFEYDKKNRVVISINENGFFGVLAPRVSIVFTRHHEVSTRKNPSIERAIPLVTLPRPDEAVEDLDEY